MKEFDKLSFTERELDEKLNSPAQTSIAHMVKTLPEDDLSLSWRSQLNEKLRAAAPVKKAKRIWDVLVPATAMASCAALAFILVSSRNEPTVPATNTDVEAAIVSAYTDHSNAREIGGYGLFLEETDNKTSAAVESDYSEVDLGTL